MTSFHLKGTLQKLFIVTAGIVCSSGTVAAQPSIQPGPSVQGPTSDQASVQDSGCPVLVTHRYIPKDSVSGQARDLYVCVNNGTAANMAVFVLKNVAPGTPVSEMIVATSGAPLIPLDSNGYVSFAPRAFYLVAPTGDVTPPTLPSAPLVSSSLTPTAGSSFRVIKFAYEGADGVVGRLVGDNSTTFALSAVQEIDRDSSGNYVNVSSVLGLGNTYVEGIALDLGDLIGRTGAYRVPIMMGTQAQTPAPEAGVASRAPPRNSPVATSRAPN